MAIIEWDTEKEKEDYEALGKLRDRYISLVNDLVKPKDTGINKILDSTETPVNKMLELTDILTSNLTSHIYVLKEFPDFVNKASKMLIDEIQDQHPNISDTVTILIAKEFEYYVKGLAFAMNDIRLGA